MEQQEPEGGDVNYSLRMSRNIGRSLGIMQPFREVNNLIEEAQAYVRAHEERQNQQTQG